MIVVLYLLFLCYISFVIACCVAWIKKSPFEYKKTNDEIVLSLVVCAKNEEKALPSLINSIESQLKKIDKVIFIDDHSEDSTIAILNDFANRHNNVSVSRAFEYGKKNALRQAIDNINSGYILTTDADCIIENNYFDLVKEFLKYDKPDLMIGSVKYIQRNSFFSKLQSLEFASLSATTAGSAILNCPIMCNAANMAFSKEIWQKAKNNLADNELSGDDVFLLHFIKKINGKISYLKHKDSFVRTFSSNTFEEFYNQRKRWVSKSKSYSDKQTILVALLVLTTNISIIYCMILSFFNLAFLFFILLKIVVDSIILIPFFNFSQQLKLIKFIPILSIIYPFYIVFTAFSGLFGKYKWK